jgi:SAM-dependent methyltransferase
MLHRIATPEFRHNILRRLPSSARHGLVDRHITKQSTLLKRIRREFGEKWLESFPGVGKNDSGDYKAFPEIGNAKTTGDLISEFWKNVPAEDWGNAPSRYAQSTRTWDIEWMKRHVDRLLPARGSVLDFGCNAGRVLHCLVEAGYRGFGVEINPKAVELGKKSFPSLERATFFVGDGPESLKKVPTGSIDLIYSCHALRHVAPEKIDAVLAEFSRITPKYILTHEDEASFSYRTYPHDYRDKLQALGWMNVRSEYAIDVENDELNHDLLSSGSMLRVYSRVPRDSVVQQQRHGYRVGKIAHQTFV